MGPRTPMYNERTGTEHVRFLPTRQALREGGDRPKQEGDHPDPAIVSREVQRRVVVLVSGGDVSARIQKVGHASLVPL